MKVQWFIRTQAFLTLLGIRGLTQTDLAGLAKLHSSDLSLFINREKPIGIRRMSRIKSRLGISDEALLDFFEPVGGDESPFRKSDCGNGSPLPAISAGRADSQVSSSNL